MATDRRGLVLPLLLLAYLFLQPEPIQRTTHLDGRPLIDDAIDRERHSLSVLQNATWNPKFGSAGSTLNLTGLEPERGFAWDALKIVKSKVNKQLEYALGQWGSRALAGEDIPGDVPPLYMNVTGHIQGNWKRSSLEGSLPRPQLNWSEYSVPEPLQQRNRAINSFHRNITGSHGEVAFQIEQKIVSANSVRSANSTDNTTRIVADAKFTDAVTHDEEVLKLHGVYFRNLGQAILTTTSAKYAGIFALPQLALSRHTFDAAQTVLNTSITRTIQRQLDRATESLNPWAPTIEGGSDPFFVYPECELVIYLQQMTPSARPEITTAMIHFLEKELQFPTGATLPNAPDLHFSMVAFSPDCGFMLESHGPPEDFAGDGDHLRGPKEAVLYQQSRHHLLIYTAALAVQLALLMRQMREASTPSTRSRISFYTIAMMALGDGFATMTFMLISLFITGLWVNLVVTGFLAFINVSFFGMRFLMDIWQVQAPERERRARAEVEEERRREEAFQAAMERIRTQGEARREALRQEAAANSNASADAVVTITTATNDNPPPTAVVAPTLQTDLAPSLPPPVTAPRLVDTGATPVFMPSDQAGLESVGGPVTNQTDTAAAVQARMPTFASLYVRFYLLLLGATFLSLHATSWPGVAQRVYFTFLALMYFSFWIPQIHRNVQRNCRHAFHWEFVLGQSALRLVPFVYFYAYGNNVLFVDKDYIGLSIIILWVWIQVVVLGSQELVGPRWFIKKDWAPAAYDYHPVLRADEEGATMPIGYAQAQEAATAPSSPTQERTSSSPLARRGSVVKVTKEKGKRIFDCAICMQDLEVPIIEAGASSDAGLAGGLLARRSYMLAPCRHIFHSACLEGWMKYRLQCPICRETLPPL